MLFQRTMRAIAQPAEPPAMTPDELAAYAYRLHRACTLLQREPPSDARSLALDLAYDAERLLNAARRASRP